MITNDNNTVPLPSDIQARIENAKNYITEMEAEYARLKKFCSELTDKINAQYIEKKNLDTELSNLANAITETSKSLAEYQTQVTIQTAILDKVSSERKEAEALLEKTHAQIEAKRGELDARESATDTHEILISTRLKALEEAENAHKTKVKKLQDAIS